MTILILGGPDDDHALHMHHTLSTHGHDVEFLDSRDFPTCMQVSYDPLANRGEIILPAGRKIQTAEIQSGIPVIELPGPE